MLDDNFLTYRVIDDGLDATPIRELRFTRLYHNRRLRRLVRKILFSNGVFLWDLEDCECDVWATLWSTSFLDHDDFISIDRAANTYLVKTAKSQAVNYHKYCNADRRAVSRTVSLEALAEQDSKSDENAHKYDAALNPSRRAKYVAELDRCEDGEYRAARCHSERPHYSKGLCRPCYRKANAEAMTPKQKAAFLAKNRKNAAACQARKRLATT